VIEGLDLNRFNLFAGLESAQIERVAQICNQMEFSPEETIFEEGDQGNHLFLISGGSVKIFKFISPQFDDALIYLGEGEVFGELSFIDGGPRSCMATALSDCVTATLSRNDLDGLISETPEIGLKIFSQIAGLAADRLRITNDKFKQGILNGLDMSGSLVMGLHYIITDRMDIEVDLKNGKQIKGKIMLVNRGDLEYEVTIKDEEGKLNIIPYHAINYLTTI
jgi:signal-transduction protein with cAMP-binding, CBS, and nucleotidyltransferase domain